MLTSMAVDVLEESGIFNAVIRPPSNVNGQYRLDLEIRRLQPEFFSTPSQVHLNLHAHLSDTVTRQVLARQEFDVLVAVPSDAPYCDVMSTNKAIHTV